FAGMASLVLYTAHLVERRGREHARELDRARSEIDRVVAAQRNEHNDARKREARVRKTMREITTLLSAQKQDERKQRTKSAAKKAEKDKLWRAQDLLWAGFSDSGLKRLRGLGADAEATSEVRAEAHRTLSDWHR